jgi:hypothetical protein
MEENYQTNDRVCDLIDKHWDDLTEKEQESIRLSNETMKFFINGEPTDFMFERMDYEYNSMLKILESKEQWI